MSVLCGASSAHGAEESFRVVVHPQVKGNQIARAALASIFLKQAPRWSDGSAVLPVDQSIRSGVRSSFSNRMLGKSLLEVQVYWQHQIGRGITPPPVKGSDDEVLGYVASTPGAIGYVSNSASVPQGVKAIVVTD
jgi:ABC-type phosphate transport system substrate-binding protein